MSTTPFWSTGEVEPKRNFRFQVQLGDSTTAPVVWWAKSVTLPSWDVAEVEHNYLDNKYYFPGRVTWNDVTLTLVDPISIDAVAKTNTILENQNYLIKPNDGANPLTITHPSSLVVKIIIYDAAGKTIEEWTLNRAFVKSAKFGDLDYSNDELKTVEMTLRYDWATCDTTNNPLTSEADGFFEKS